MKHPLITAEELREMLSYDPDTGAFKWKVKRKGRKSFGVSGSYDGKYSQIGINYKTYLSHRLAWLYVHGSFPKGQLDHINGIRFDNRIANLRESNQRENCCNRKTHREGKLPGCSYIPNSRKWQAVISIDGKRKSLGYFSSEEAAHHTYLIWKHNLGL